MAATSGLLAQTAKLRWGDEGWAAHCRTVGGSVHGWFGGSGGHIHRSDQVFGLASWSDAAVPAVAKDSILDIWFEPNGVIGYACGRGGRILKSTDGGHSWQVFGSIVKDAKGNPATLWGIRPVTIDGGFMFVTGLWCISYTENYGTSWKSVDVYDADPAAGGHVISQMKLEAFKLDLIRTHQGMVAAVGAEYEDPSNPIDGSTKVPVLPFGGVMLYTDSRVAAANGGRSWWIVAHDMSQPATGAVPTPPGTPVVRASPIMVEPWSLRFEVGASNLDTARGVVVGGRGGNELSRWWWTTNSGRTWTHNPMTEFGPVTMYDAALTASGEAAIVGYSGVVMHRAAPGATWKTTVLDSPVTAIPSPDFDTSALGGAAGFLQAGGTRLGLAVNGDFGTRRVSSGFVNFDWSWSAANPLYPLLTELEFRGVDFDGTLAVGGAQIGLMAGQYGRIYRTDDGGQKWFDVALGGPNCNAVAINGSGQAVMVGDSNQAKSSNDFGATWVVETIVPAGGSVSWTEVAVAPAGLRAVAIGRDAGGQLVWTRSPLGIWSSVAVPAPGLTFHAVRLDSDGNAIVVGRTGDGLQSRARAYRLVLTGAAPVWQPLAVPTAVGAVRSELFDVAVVGSVASGTAQCVAVGDWDVVSPSKRGLVLELSAAGFIAPPSLASGVNLDIVLRAVDISPSGNRVLIGGDYSRENDEIHDAGFLLVRNGGTWSRTRADTGKGLTSMRFLGENKAFGLGLTDNNLHATFVNAQLASTSLVEIVW